tara:strand:- start:2098 stop:3348 length:1251 start_codon:yes stop_codon:yes gene_type:complete
MVNEYFELLNYGGSFYYYIFELANFLFLAILAIFFYKLQIININSLIVWVGLFSVPLFLNYFLFSPFLFPDQFQYSGEVTSIKSRGVSLPHIEAQGLEGFSEDISNIFGIINPVTLTIKLLGLAPIPNYMTVTSLAFANKFFLFLVFIWLKRFFNNENTLLLFFLVPSLVLYSSLSLRDNLIVIISILFFINILRSKYIFAAIFLAPLFILKLQMFAFFLIYYIGRLIFRAHKSLNYLFLYFVIILASSFTFNDVILEIINSYRYGFAAEDLDLGNGLYGYAAWSLYGDQIIDSITIDSMPELIFLAIIGLPNLLLMPLPGSWENIFYPVQFLESILLICLYGWITVKYKLYKNSEFIFLTFSLTISLLVYSLLAFNEGTFVRYRFTLFFPYVIATFYLAINKNSLTDNSDKVNSK